MKKQIHLLIIVLFLFNLFICLNQINAQIGWVSQNSGTNNDLWFVTFLNANTGYAVGESGTIRKTTNGGNNWFPQMSGTSDTLFCVNFIDENIGTAVGQSGTIRRTINGGINWFPQNSGTSYTLKSVSFINSNTGILVGFNGLIRKTTNGGINWYSQTSGTYNNLWSTFLLNVNTGWAVGYSGTVRKTTNGGTNWFPQSVGSSYAELLYVSFLNANTGVITVGIPGNIGIYFTQNGGITWTPRNIGSGHSQRSIDFVDANNWMMVGDEGDFSRTADGGSTWSFLPIGIMNWLFSTSFVNTNTGWAVGTSGIILKTTTGGVELPNPPSNLIGFAISDTSIFLAWYDNSTNETGFKIERSINSVSNWALIDSVGTNVENYIDDNGLVPNNTYFYRVYSYRFGANSPYSNTIFVYLTDIRKISTNIPEEYNLFQNYPNPFNPSTNIKFDIPKPSQVKIIIYDNLGKVIEEFVDRKLNAGSYEVNWNGSNYPSGVYFYRIETEEFLDVKKMLLIK